MGAPFGNKNAAGPRDKMLSDALRKQLIQYEDAEVKQGEAATKIAKNIIRMALKDNEWAIQFLTDRLEGRPVQQNRVDVEHSGSIEHRGLPEIGQRVEDLLAGRADSDSPPLLPN